MKTIFISYSHKDEPYKVELANHLFPFEMAGSAKIWQDGMIAPGTNWDDDIKNNLENADIVLLLISSDALTSTYINNVEIKRAMEKNLRGENIVIPVVLRPCNWTILPIAQIQALPKGGKAVSLWNSTDEAFLNVAKGIEPLL